MAVQEVDERYKCSICGNEVMVTTVGGGTLVCCGEEMEQQGKVDLPEVLPELWPAG